MVKSVELGELISPANTIRCGDCSYPVLSMTMHKGLVFQSEKFNKIIASKDTSDYKVVYRNQLVISFPIDEGVLATQRITDAGIVSPAYGIWDIDKELVLPEYLEYALRSNRAIQYYKAKLRGSTARRRSLPTPTLLSFQIQLPSLEEQYGILDKVHRVKEIVRLRETQLKKLDTLTKSRFIEMFGDPIINPMGWPVVTIKDIVSEVKYGTSKPAAIGGKYPYLRMNNLTSDGSLDLTDLKYIDIDDNELEKYVVRKGDVLFNRTNSIDLIGKTATFDLDQEMIIAGYIIRVRLKDLILPEFFTRYMNLDPIKNMLKNIAKGAVNQANINAQELQNIQIYLPDIEIQKQYKAVMNSIDKSRDAIQKSLDETQLLFDSLMQEYFG